MGPQDRSTQSGTAQPEADQAADETALIKMPAPKPPPRHGTLFLPLVFAIKPRKLVSEDRKQIL